MALNKENILFIDNYLKKSEVVFDDLRLELVDHIASAITLKMSNEDLDFYDAFKSYMVENKKEILKAGMVNQKVNLKLAISKFLNFLKLKGVIVFSVVLFFLASNTFKASLIPYLPAFQSTILIAIMAFTIIWITVFYGILRKRFFVLENNTFLLYIIFQLFNFSRMLWENNPEMEFYASLSIGLLIVLYMFFMCKSSIEFYSKNKDLYAIG